MTRFVDSAKLETNDYQYNPSNVPPIRVLGQDDFHGDVEAEDVVPIEETEEPESLSEAVVKEGSFDSPDVVSHTTHPPGSVH